MDAETRKAMEAVVTYLWDDEEKDFNEGDHDGAHIFESLVVLRKALTA